MSISKRGKTASWDKILAASSSISLNFLFLYFISPSCWRCWWWWRVPSGWWSLPSSPPVVQTSADRCCHVHQSQPGFERWIQIIQTIPEKENCGYQKCQFEYSQLFGFQLQQVAVQIFLNILRIFPITTGGVGRGGLATAWVCHRLQKLNDAESYQARASRFKKEDFWLLRAHQWEMQRYHHC